MQCKVSGRIFCDDNISLKTTHMIKVTFINGVQNTSLCTKLKKTRQVVAAQTSAVPR
jgi:hypothetical protein